jgi:hypothetical protein
VARRISERNGDEPLQLSLSWPFFHFLLYENLIRLLLLERGKGSAVMNHQAFGFHLAQKQCDRGAGFPIEIQIRGVIRKTTLAGAYPVLVCFSTVRCQKRAVSIELECHKALRDRCFRTICSDPGFEDPSSGKCGSIVWLRGRSGLAGASHDQKGKKAEKGENLIGAGEKWLFHWSVGYPVTRRGDLTQKMTIASSFFQEDSS